MAAVMRFGAPVPIGSGTDPERAPEELGPCGAQAETPMRITSAMDATRTAQQRIGFNPPLPLASPYSNAGETWMIPRAVAIALALVTLAACAPSQTASQAARSPAAPREVQSTRVLNIVVRTEGGSAAAKALQT